MQVKLIASTPDAENLIATAARICYAKNPNSIFKAKDSGKFIDMLIKKGHLSPFEHANFTFYISGISRACSHQLVRHRTFSFSQRSQRFIKEENFKYVIPNKLKDKLIEMDKGVVKSATDRYREIMAEIAKNYDELSTLLGDCGEVSNEDARYVLPNACETSLIMTCDARNLLHFFEERLCTKAQHEIRKMAKMMLREVIEICPNIFKYAAPKCKKFGFCPEENEKCANYKSFKYPEAKKHG